MQKNPQLWKKSAILDRGSLLSRVPQETSDNDCCAGRPIDRSMAAQKAPPAWSSGRKRLVNGFSFGLAEHGRLGIGLPDDMRMVREAGCVVGWHKARDPLDEAEVPLAGATRLHRTHVPGLARLAKLPHSLPEEAVGSSGGVVLPSPVARPIRADGPRIVSVTGACFSALPFLRLLRPLSSARRRPAGFHPRLCR